MNSGRAAPPLISVVMAVHNGGELLRSAVESVLTQTMKDFEFIIVDDGSRDNSRELVAGLRDERIRLLVNERNLGLAQSLNRAVLQTKGRYIARMDADDISLPDRLRRQVEFMEKHPAVGASGTGIEIFGTGRTKACRKSQFPEETKVDLLFNSPIFHPTAIFRREFFFEKKIFYDDAFKFSQDYDLWERASHSTQLTNLNYILLRYRIHKHQIGSHNRKEQRKYADLVRRRHVRRLVADATEMELGIHRKISENEICGLDFLISAGDWLLRILDANEKNRIYEKSALKNCLAEKWWSICGASKLGMDAYRVFSSNVLQASVRRKLVRKMNFIFRSLIEAKV